MKTYWKKPKNSKYRSGFEQTVAGYLERKNINFKYEKKKIKYLKEHSYKTDFELPNGIIIETKGYFKAADRQKHLDIKKQHPHLDIRFIFMSNGKLHKLNPTRYADWCTKNGFKFAVSPEGVVPKEWLEEGNKSEKTNSTRKSRPLSKRGKKSNSTSSK